jgi:hypothetical protein
LLHCIPYPFTAIKSILFSLIFSLSLQENIFIFAFVFFLTLIIHKFYSFNKTSYWCCITLIHLQQLNSDYQCVIPRLTIQKVSDHTIILTFYS